MVKVSLQSFIAEHRRHNDIDAPEQVVLWDTIIEPEFINKLA